MTDPLRTYDGFLPGTHIVAGLGQGGFRFADMSHRGSLIFAPDGVRRWSPPEPYRHSEALLDQIAACPLPIDLLLVGTGTMPLPLPVDLREMFRARGIAVDVMLTTAAASTYNVLVEERRRVAAALVAID